MKKLLLLVVFSILIKPIYAQTGTTATGTSAGTAGDHNSHYGFFSGNASTNLAFYNSFFGAFSGRSNSSGYFNTAVGASSLFSNFSGTYNTAAGYVALYYNSSGAYNNASGAFALYNNSTGSFNTATGTDALALNTTGFYNTASGNRSLYANTTGGYNSAFGYNAGPTVNNLSNTTAIGNGAKTSASNQVRIGNSSVTSIGGQVSWSTLSDGRFKRDIKENVSGLDFINQLRPVTYIVDTEAYDAFLGIPDSLRQKQSSARKAAIRQTGFIAQEVEAAINKTGFVFHGVEVPQNENDHYSIRYAEFVVPLVKAVQELTVKAEAQQKKIDLLLNQLNKSNQINQELLSDGAILLFQNAPNPFTEGTDIKMILPEDVHQANLIIYNLEGKQLKSVPVQTRGNAVVKFAGHELSAGIYIYTLIADGKIIDTKKMILTK
jgi:hypothetical protein